MRKPSSLAYPKLRVRQLLPFHDKTNIFSLKIELLPLTGPECKYLPIQNCKTHQFIIPNRKNVNSISKLYVHVNGSLAQ